MKRSYCILSVLFVLFLSVSFYCDACDQFMNNQTDTISNESIENRIYVQPEQVHILEDGIFLDLYGKFISINQLCSDSDGIYVDKLVAGKALGFCPNGHSRSCATCHGCYQKKDCRYGCKCR